MQLNISILSTLIALAIAGPLPEAQPARRTVSAALAQTCAILGTNVNCRYHAKTGVDSPVQWVFSGGSAFFTCNSPGECISGNWYAYLLARIVIH